jgi:hypothetical protein
MAGDSKGKGGGRAGAAGGGRNKEKLTDAEILELRRILSQGGLTNKTESADGEDSAVGPEPCCEHICDQQSAGLLNCEGSGPPGVFPDTAADGVEYAMTCKDGVKRWKNAAALAAALVDAVKADPELRKALGAALDPEQAPAPRENGGPEEQVNM